MKFYLTWRKLYYWVIGAYSSAIVCCWTILLSSIGKTIMWRRPILIIISVSVCVYCYFRIYSTDSRQIVCSLEKQCEDNAWRQCLMMMVDENCLLWSVMTIVEDDNHRWQYFMTIISINHQLSLNITFKFYLLADHSLPSCPLIWTFF